MCEDEARRYGSYARYLFELSRAEDSAAIELFLHEMDERDLRKLVLYLVHAGGVLSGE